MISRKILFLLGATGIGLATGGSAEEAPNASDLQQMIEQAYAAGTGRITLAAGEYRLSAPAGANACLRFAGMKDFEIDARGVTFLCAERTKTSVIFDQCQRVTLRGATFRHDPVPFSQGKIVALGDDRKSVDVRVAAGYPEDLDDPRFFFGGHGMMINLFDPETRQWKRDVSDVGFGKVERLGPGLFRFHLGGAWEADFPIAAGDLAAWRGRLAADIFLRDCEGMRLEDLAFQSGSGFCIHENGGEGGSFYRYTVRRGPAPAGASEPPLFSANADAFHSSNMRRGPALEDCHFEYMDDDGVPIHGTYAMVLDAREELVTLAARFADYCRTGDTLRFYDESGALAGEARAAGVKPLPDYQPARQPPEKFRNYQDAGKLVYTEVRLEKSVPAKFSWLASNADALGSGFAVRRCVIRNHRARGMLIKAGEGVIEDCLVEGSTMGGIVVSPEMTFWNEADYARGVVIRHTTIRGVGIWRQAWNPMAGALSIAAYDHKQFVPLPGGHRGIVVENNLFENNAGVNVVVSSAKNIAFRNNRFVNPMSSPARRGEALGVDAGALFWLTQSSGITIEGNAIESPGPFMKTTVKATESVLESNY